MSKSPIQKVTNKLQYRAIGIIKGIYKPFKSNSLNKGIIIDKSGIEVDAVVLGKVLPLIRKHVDLLKQNYWIVYPRNKNSDNLHLQIVGIWDPFTLNNTTVDSSKEPEQLLTELNLKDNFFSIRGKLIFVNESEKEIIIKICPLNRTDKSKQKPFKVIVKGEIPIKFINSFVSLNTFRKNNHLFMDNFEIIETNVSNK
tara:strand:+ start:1542 stop:2135 length:594 start_codon:yes stop_codon:yes gene_type:complete